MERIIILCCVLVCSFIGASALKCNLCLGQLNGACAKRDASEMVVQNCENLPPHGGGGRQGFYGRRGPPPPSPPPRNEIDETTTNNSGADVAADNNSTRPSYHGHHHHGPRDHPKLVQYCMVITLGDSNFTSPMAERGCGWMVPDVDICGFIKKKVNYIEKCTACTSDFCN